MIQTDQPNQPSILKPIKWVVQVTSLSKASIYRKIKEGSFPASVKVSKGRSAWRDREVHDWIASL